MDKELPISVWPEWKITGKIGEGSFGRVYKAQRTEKGRSFYSAIKIITIPANKGELNSVRSESGDEKSVRGYFENLVEECIQEVSTMEYFRGNSHIVSVEDYKVVEYLDEIGWDISIRMEYLTSFMEYYAGKNLTENEVIKLGMDLCMALEYCGQLHIIHRDIKPENIFVSRFGDFKLGDFGIARELERSMSSLSKKGTYSYMAPEMYRGEQYDSRVDIYSLGLVLYKLMNHNRLPFLNLDKQLITYRDKENALAKRMSGETPPLPADAGEEFGQVILKACAFDPEKRYSTPRELRRALEDLVYGRNKGVDSEPDPGNDRSGIFYPVKEETPDKTVVRDRMTFSRDRNDDPDGSYEDENDPDEDYQGEDDLNRDYPGKNYQGKDDQNENYRDRDYRDNRAYEDRNYPDEDFSDEDYPAQRREEPDLPEDSGRDLQEWGVPLTREEIQNRRRRNEQNRKISRMTIGVLVFAAALLLLLGGITLMHNRFANSGNDFDITKEGNYGTSEDADKSFTEAMETIKEHATTISDDLDSYKTEGTEGQRLRYYNSDGEIAKVLVYPSLSDDGKYEEYYYWHEQLFFAYIWDQDDKEYFYYQDGLLIRWIDSNNKVHDQESSNDKYVELGDKYWSNSVMELQ